MLRELSIKSIVTYLSLFIVAILCSYLFVDCIYNNYNTFSYLFIKSRILSFQETSSYIGSVIGIPVSAMGALLGIMLATQALKTTKEMNASNEKSYELENIRFFCEYARDSANYYGNLLSIISDMSLLSNSYNNNSTINDDFYDNLVELKAEFVKVLENIKNDNFGVNLWYSKFSKSANNSLLLARSKVKNEYISKLVDKFDIDPDKLVHINYLLFKLRKTPSREEFYKSVEESKKYILSDDNIIDPIFFASWIMFIRPYGVNFGYLLLMTIVQNLPTANDFINKYCNIYERDDLDTYSKIRDILLYDENIYLNNKLKTISVLLKAEDNDLRLFDIAVSEIHPSTCDQPT